MIKVINDTSTKNETNNDNNKNFISLSEGFSKKTTQAKARGRSQARENSARARQIKIGFRPCRVYTEVHFSKALGFSNLFFLLLKRILVPKKGHSYFYKVIAN